MYLLPLYITNWCSLHLPTCPTRSSPLILVLIPFLLHTSATFPGSLAVDRAFSSQGKELMFLDVNCIGHESSLLQHVSTKVIAVPNCEKSKRLCYMCIIQFLITPRSCATAHCRCSPRQYPCHHPSHPKIQERGLVTPALSGFTIQASILWLLRYTIVCILQSYPQTSTSTMHFAGLYSIFFSLWFPKKINKKRPGVLVIFK